jgi:hypothetical protein
VLRPGSVIRIYDKFADPAQAKRHICVCPDRRVFLRINSRDFWPPSHRLDFAVNRSFLDDTSFVELRQLFRFDVGAVRAAVALGRLSRAEAKDLAWSAKRAPTLSEERQDLVWDRLVTNWRDD